MNTNFPFAANVIYWPGRIYFLSFALNLMTQDITREKNKAQTMVRSKIKYPLQQLISVNTQMWNYVIAK